MRELKSIADKIPGKTAIPAGLYNVELTFSPKFKRELPLILNVPYFEGIRIHRGNKDEDTEGCLIPGLNKAKGMVFDSTHYEKTIIWLMKYAKFKNELVQILITR